MRRRLTRPRRNDETSSVPAGGGLGGRRDRSRQARYRPVHAGAQVAADVELPEIARHHLWRAGSLRQGGRGGERQQVPDSALCRGRDRAGPAGRRCRAKRHGRDVPYRVLLLFRQGFHFRLRHRRAVRSQQPHANRLDVFRRRHGADERLLQEVPYLRDSGRQYRRPNGGLVPQGDPGAVRSQRAQNADRRLCRARHFEARRGAAADRWRRHLSGAGEGDARRLRVGRSLRRREAGLPEGGAVLLLPGLVGRRAHAAQFINLDKWNALPPAYKSLVRTAFSMANEWMQAKYDAANPAALKRLVAGGAQLRPFTQPIMDASLRAALDLYAEVSKSNADFKKVWEAMLAFRNDQYLWWQVAELTYDTYLVRNRSRT